MLNNIEIFTLAGAGGLGGGVIPCPGRPGVAFIRGRGLVACVLHSPLSSE